MVIVSCGAFLLVQFFIISHILLARGFGIKLHHLLNADALPHKQSCYHDSSCIHHRVMRSSFRIKHWCIECDTTWFLSYELMDVLPNQIVEQGVGYNLGDGLDGEEVGDVSLLGELPIN